MVIAKTGLFACVLILAGLSFWAARRWTVSGNPIILPQRVAAYIEIENILAIALLFTAASLTGFPPAVDIPEETASSAEIWTMFSPKVPRLAGLNRFSLMRLNSQIYERANRVAKKI